MSEIVELEVQENLDEITDKVDKLGEGIDKAKEANEKYKESVDKMSKAVKEHIGVEKVWMNTKKAFNALLNPKETIGKFVNGVKSSISALNEQRKSITLAGTAQKAWNGITNASKIAFKGLGMAMKATGIGLLVAALGGLISYMKGTTKGAKQLAVITDTIGILFNKLTAVLAPIGEMLVNLFTEPQKGLSQLVDMIKSQVINRVKAMGKVFQAVGKIISSGFTKGYDDLSNATAQAVTGVEDAGKKMKAAAKEALRQSKAIQKLKEEYYNLNKALTDNISKYQTEVEVLKAVSDDATLSLAKRAEARKRAAALELKISKEQMALAKNEMEQARKQVEIYAEGTTERAKAEKEYLEKKKEYAEAETEVSLKQFDNDKVLREMRSDTAEQDLDIIERGFEKKNELYEKDFEKAKGNIEQTKNLNEQRLKDIQDNALQQQNILQQFSDKKIDIQKLASISDERELQKQVKSIGLSEALTTRLLEVIGLFNERKKELDDNLQTSQDEAESKEKETQKRRVEQYKKFTEDIKNIEKPSISFTADTEDEFQEQLDLALEQEQTRQEALRDKILAETSLTEEQKQALIKSLNEKGQANINTIKEKGAEYDKELTKKKNKAKLDATIGGAKDAANLANVIVGDNAEAQKALSISNAVINTAEGVSKATAQTGALSPLVIPTIIATGVAQVAKIAATPIPKPKKFALGGLITGASHLSGGVGVEAEGGEFIVNKRAMSNPDTANAVKALNAGQTPNTGGQDLTAIVRAIQDLNVFVSVQDIQTGLNKAEVTQDRFSV